MKEFFGSVIAIIVVAVALFIVPVKGETARTDNVVSAYVYTITNDFVDNVELNGYISLDTYNEFQSKLASTGNSYIVTMVHGHDIYTPKFNTAGSAITGITTISSATYEDEILEELYDKSGIYYFEKDDHFSITVKNKNRTISQKINRLLTGASVKYSIVATAGGTIRNENY